MDSKAITNMVTKKMFTNCTWVAPTVGKYTTNLATMVGSFCEINSEESGKQNCVLVRKCGAMTSNTLASKW